MTQKQFSHEDISMAAIHFFKKNDSTEALIMSTEEKDSIHAVLSGDTYWDSSFFIFTLWL